MNRNFVSTTEFADLLKVNRRTVGEWVRTQIIPADCIVQVNNVVRIDVDQALKALTPAAASA